MLDIFRLSPSRYDRIIAIAHLPLVDEYGNTKEDWVAEVSLTNEDLKRINFGQFYQGRSTENSRKILISNCLLLVTKYNLA